MKLIFLGILGGIQSKDSGNVSLIISENKTSILIDTSGSPVELLLKSEINLLSLEAVFLTHSHIDHLYALPSLIHNLWLLKREKPLPVYGNRETLDSARSLCGVFNLESKKDMFSIEWQAVDNNTISINELQCTAFPLSHGVPSTGYIFSSFGKKLVYAADTIPLKEYPAAAEQADILIHEAGGTGKEKEKLLNSGHSSGLDAGNAARKLNVKKLILCHLPAEKKHQTAILEEAQQAFSLSEIPALFTPYEI